MRERGQEDLVIQTTHFGYEAHDDLMDAGIISWRMLLDTQESTGLVWIG